MILIFTKSKKIGSRLIRWALGEEFSHFAIGFDCDPDGFGVVIHSHFRGVEIRWFKDFEKQVDEYEIYWPPRELGLNEQERIWQSIVQKVAGKRYDFTAFAWFAWIAIRRKWFKLPFPRRNIADSSGLLCTELYRYLSFADRQLFPELDGDMVTPDQIKGQAIVAGWKSDPD
jgi:hypothetical protein